MSEATQAWVQETTTGLQQTFDGLGFATRLIDQPERGRGLLVDVDEDYFALVFAAMSEGPAVVYISTIVLEDVPRDQWWDALSCANAWAATRAFGRMVVTNRPTSLLITLQWTEGPAILQNVPPYAGASLSAFAAQARVARVFARRAGISGRRIRPTELGDGASMLAALDDRTQLLLDMDDLLSPDD
jgi:hypothetical protein